MAKTLEEDFEELEGIIEQMESEGIPLEKSFELYEKGMKKLKSANEKIEAVEKKVVMLQEDGSTTDIEE